MLSEPATGRVMAVYSKAAYLRLPAGLVALTCFGVPAGPLHARTSERFDTLREGEEVIVTESRLHAGSSEFTLERATFWQGALPEAERLFSRRQLATKLFESAPRSSLDSGIVEEAGLLARRSRLPELTALLGGRGAGLTPAGDDCLAGILLISSILGTGELKEMAACVRTNRISLAFLRWAAEGQSIEPVHRFLNAVASGAFTEASAALDSLVAFGHSSGADLALGLRVGMDTCLAG